MEIEFGTELDLHHFHPDDTETLIREFLKHAKENHLKRVRIAHGKGRSKKKFRLYKILECHPDVLRFGDDGANWGATIVLLK